MHTPINLFKKAMAEKRAQIGLWVGLADETHRGREVGLSLIHI